MVGIEVLNLGPRGLGEPSSVPAALESSTAHGAVLSLSRERGAKLGLSPLDTQGKFNTLTNNLENLANIKLTKQNHDRP